MTNFFRVDEFNAAHNSSRVFFYDAHSEALKHVTGFREVEACETEGQEHTTIQAFVAATCDMDGWNDAVEHLGSVSYLPQ